MTITTTVHLSESPIEGKKWRASFEGHHVDFGSEGYEDYTMHKDCRRMVMYLTRHQALPKSEVASLRKRMKEGMMACEDVIRTSLSFSSSASERWDDPRTAGFWSRWLLWSRPSMRDAKQTLFERFGIRVVTKKGVASQKRRK